MQGRCVSGGGAIDLRRVSACNDGEDESGASPLLQALSNGIEDATDFAVELRSYTPTLSFDAPLKVGKAQTRTIALTPDFNVIDVPAITIGPAAALVLDGASTSSVIIRVAGNLMMRNTARFDLRGGIVPQHVVVLVEGSAVRLSNKSSLTGTLFASDGSCRLRNQVSLTGSIVCGGKITLGGGDVVSFEPLDPNLLTAKLYVVDSPLLAAPNVREYRNPASSGGDASPLAVLGGPATALQSPVFVALDRNGAGTVYITNPNSAELPQSINGYAQPINGDHAPSPFIFGGHTGLINPTGIAIDSSGKIYATNTMGNRLAVYPTGSNGDQSPLFTIEGPHTGLSGPVGLALDGNENIWTVNVSAPCIIAKYQNGQCASGTTCDQSPALVISNPALSGPTDLAFDRRGNIWVTNSGTSSPTGVDSVLEFSPLGTLLVTIEGARTTLNFPFGIAIDGAGNVLVANFESSSIVGFRPDACTPADTQPCNIKPDFTLAGPNSELIQPAGLAFGP